MNRSLESTCATCSVTLNRRLPGLIGSPDRSSILPLLSERKTHNRLEHFSLHREPDKGVTNPFFLRKNDVERHGFSLRPKGEMLWRHK
jgi:hypothetical protein